MNKHLTIALIGPLPAEARSVISRLAEIGHSLIRIGGEEDLKDKWHRQLIKGKKLAVQDCIKEGCWEADVVILLPDAVFNEKNVARIKQVVTQKLVICMKFDKDADSPNLKAWFPYSRIATAVLNKQSSGWKVVNIESASDDAAAETRQLLMHDQNELSLSK